MKNIYKIYNIKLNKKEREVSASRKYFCDSGRKRYTLISLLVKTLDVAWKSL